MCTFHLRPFLGPLFMLEVVVTEDRNGMKLNKIMDKGDDLLTNAIFYNQKNLHVVILSEKVIVVDVTVSFDNAKSFLMEFCSFILL